MQSDNIIKKYKDAFEKLEKYDRTLKLDVGRKRIDITLDNQLVKRLKSASKSKHRAMSRIIEDALNVYLKKVS